MSSFQPKATLINIIPIFQSTVASNRGLKATETVLKYLEKIDQPEPEVKEESFDDITLFDMTKDESSITLQQAPNMSSSHFELDEDFDKL